MLNSANPTPSHSPVIRHPDQKIQFTNEDSPNSLSGLGYDSSTNIITFDPNQIYGSNPNSGGSIKSDEENPNQSPTGYENLYNNDSLSELENPLFHSENDDLQMHQQ